MLGDSIDSIGINGGTQKGLGLRLVSYGTGLGTGLGFRLGKLSTTSKNELQDLIFGDSRVQYVSNKFSGQWGSLARAWEVPGSRRFRCHNQIKN